MGQQFIYSGDINDSKPSREPTGIFTSTITVNIRNKT